MGLGATGRRGRRSSAWALGVAVVLTGCGKRERASPSDAAPTEAWASSDAGAAGAGRDTWRVVQGVAPFLMRGKHGTLRGSVRRMRGDLEVDFADVTRTRGTIAFDLTSLVMTSFEDEVKNAKQTEDALFWLGVDAKAA